MALALEELSGCIPGGTDPARELQTAELSRLLRNFVGTLKSAERKAFILRYWYLEPIAAIAEAQGFSQSKVKSMLFRTRNKLHSYLKKEGIDL